MIDRTELLDRIKEIILQRDPEAKIYLYGSRVKGTAGEDSDWDLLILLNAEEITPTMEKSITYPLYDLEFDTGMVISPMVYSEKEWNSKYRVTPYYRTVMQEGKRL